MKLLNYSTLTLICFLSLGFMSRAQYQVDSLMLADGMVDSNGYCIPRLKTMNKPKVIEFNYRNILEYGIDTRIFATDTSYSDQMRRERMLDFKAKIPILLRSNFELILGLNYRSEQFKFRNEGTTGGAFYESLNRKPLQTFGTTLYGTKPFKGNNYLSFRTSFRLSGDFSQTTYDDYFRSSVSALYGWRTSSTCSWGTGISHNYVFGRQSLMPIAFISKKFSPKLDFETVLPVSVKLRYAFNEKNILQVETRVSGESYNITLDPFDYSIFLQRSDWLSYITFDREIYDFFWIGATIGSRYNVSFDLFEKNAFLDQSEPVISNNIQHSLYAKFSLFIVPPRRLLEKHEKNR